MNQDLFESDLRPATVITLYLLPALNIKLMPQLKQLKPGTRIVSHSFDMGSEWPPDKTQQVERAEHLLLGREVSRGQANASLRVIKGVLAHGCCETR